MLTPNEERNPIKQTAVVIGCSNSHTTCNQKIHQDTEIFYSIDILGTPDLKLDITTPNLPQPLSNQFKLTILEYLPYDTYNHHQLFIDMGRGDGQQGLHNILEMTQEDGFILILGNPIDYNFRKSLSTLKYFTLAHNGDSDIILIPKNQQLSAKEALEQLGTLPKALKTAIDVATTQHNYQVQKLEAYCILNYKTTLKNKAFIEELGAYISNRNFESEYHWNFLTCLQFSRDDKTRAANALIHVLLGNNPPSSLAIHGNALLQGRLGEIVSRHLKGRPVSAFANIPNPMNLDGFRTINKEYKQSLKRESGAEEIVHTKPIFR